MQTDNISFLVSNIFDNIEKIEIRLAKIITKNRKHLMFTYPLKFNSIQIKLDLNKIVLTKKSYIEEIFPVIVYIINFINSKRITRKKLSFKEQYLAQRMKSAYIAFVCKRKTFFDLL